MPTPGRGNFPSRPRPELEDCISGFRPVEPDLCVGFGLASCGLSNRGPDPRSL